MKKSVLICIVFFYACDYDWDTSLEGHWEGKTEQGRKVTFDIEGDGITNYQFNYALRDSHGLKEDSIYFPYIRLITEYLSYEITFKFYESSSGQIKAKGGLKVAKSYDSIDVKWNARKK